MVKIKSLLSGLTVCIALLGYLPLQPYLDPFARWFFPLALIAGLCLHIKRGPLPSRVLTPLSIACFLYLAAGFTLDRLILITADLLVVFLGIRMLGERNARHYLQVFALALFCLAASSLYDLSVWFLFYLLLLLLLLAVSLVMLAFHDHDAELALDSGQLKKVLGVSSLMPVATVPILLVLFVLLPRTQYPLWDFLNSAAPKQTGFSETVSPGGSSSVSESKTAVFRAVCRQLPEPSLYWRGIVLNGFNDDAWVRLPTPQEQILRVEQGPVVHQEIYPERSSSLYLPALNFPRAFSGLRYRESEDAVFTARRPLEKRTRYEADSTLSGGIAVKGGIDREFYLRLPRTVSERLRAKGREIASSGFAPPEKLKLVERFFRSQRLAYATTGLPAGGDPLDDFLFVTRRGNCEFFASSYATLLRLAGVPARLVGGYLGGAYNEMGGYYLVTEDLAHVWVEAYLEGRGWVSVDPSAWAAGFARKDGAARRIGMYADAVAFYWDKAVITYDLETQIAAVRTAGSKARQLHLPAGAWKSLLVVTLTLLSLAALLVIYLRRPKSREARVLKRFLRTAARRHPAAFRAGGGLFELAEAVDDPDLKEFVRIYGRAVYRDRPLSPDELVRLGIIIRRLGQQLS